MKCTNTRLNRGRSMTHKAKKRRGRTKKTIVLPPLPLLRPSVGLAGFVGASHGGVSKEMSFIFLLFTVCQQAQLGNWPTPTTVQVERWVLGMIAVGDAAGSLCGPLTVYLPSNRMFIRMGRSHHVWVKKKVAIFTYSNAFKYVHDAVISSQY